MNENSDLCPVCARIGVRSNIKIYHIDLEETTTLCENKMCLYPLEGSSKLDCRVADSNCGTQNADVLLETANFDVTTPELNDFSYLNNLFDVPIHLDDNISDLIASLDASASQACETEVPCLDFTPVNGATTQSCNAQQDAVNNCKLTSKISSPNDVPDTVISNKRVIPKTKPAALRRSNNSQFHFTVATKRDNQQFTCMEQPRINVKSAKKLCQNKNPKSKPRTRTKNVHSSEKGKTNNIFTFLETVHANNVTKKKYGSTKSKTSVKILSHGGPSNGASKDPLVRQWLAKQSPRRVFPGYGAKPSRIQGTSDGRSASDSIPTSPSSHC